MTSPNLSNIQDRINKKFDSLFIKKEDGYTIPVCIVCDKLMKFDDSRLIPEELLEKNQDLLQDSFIRDTSFRPELTHEYVQSCYRYTGDNKKDWMDCCLLSPRASYINEASTVNSGREIGSNKGYTCCLDCLSSLNSNNTPVFAICNNYAMSATPECMEELTDVEVAYLTPMKSYGYCFTFTGGRCMQLKGTLSYYKVEKSSIARSFAQLQSLELECNVIVVLSGKMTDQQRKRAREYSQIRIDKIDTALQWLLKYHVGWKSVDIEAIKAQIATETPVVIDESEVEESASGDANGSNIEKTESFTVYFPDGNMTSVNGGQESIHDFKRLVKESRTDPFDLDFQCDLAREAAADYKDDNFVNACLLQFPLGIGGMNEIRKTRTGKVTENVQNMNYIKHLISLSLPQFHRPLFVLILYSIYQKQKMLVMASLELRGKQTVSNLVNGLNANDVQSAASARSNGTSGGTQVAHRFLDSMTAVARALPHTNRAARTARTNLDAVQHRHGLPHWFVTATPDDEYSILLQFLSGVVIDKLDCDVNDLSDDELLSRCKERTELRLKYPGLSAFNFEIVLDIIMKEIVGWDFEKECATTEEGLFGECLATFVSIEEQGRSSLHAHILIWVKGMKEIMKALSSSSREERRMAERTILKKIDDVSTTILIDTRGKGPSKVQSKTFDHDCTVANSIRRLPEVVSDQELRHLRHREGHSHCKGQYASCPHCTKFWSSEDLVKEYLVNHIKVPKLSAFPDRCGRLKALVLQQQKPNGKKIHSAIVHAAYDHHSSKHVSSCFKKNKKRSSLEIDNECRFRMPQAKRRKTTIDVIADDRSWFSWHGKEKKWNFREVELKRNAYDGFQNVSCFAVSGSKLACNNNIRVLTPGPIGVYVTKYNTKGTQEDDTEDFKAVTAETKAILSKDRVHDSDRAEMIRIMLRSFFAHNSTNVIRAPLAAFLIKYDLRFLQSHKVEWCSIRDFQNLIDGKEVKFQVKGRTKEQFAENKALHYLCRDRELEHLSVKDFIELYFVAYATTKREDICYNFVNTSEFQHPSFHKGKSRQCILERDEPVLLKIYQKEFPDSAGFHGSLLSEDMQITEDMEVYARCALLLLLPFRSKTDLTLQGSYVRRLRRAIEKKEISESGLEYLQNIQDVSWNCTRYDRVEDPLCRRTKSLQSTFEDEGQHQDDDEEKEKEEADSSVLDEFIRRMNEEGDKRVRTDNLGLPEGLNFSKIRRKGFSRIGFNVLCNVGKHERESSSNSHFVETSVDPTRNMNMNESDTSPQTPVRKRNPKKADIVKVLLTRSVLRRRKIPSIPPEEIANLKPANGSVKSIIQWSQKAGLDKWQRRSFEMIVGSFILRFYKDAAQEEAESTLRSTRTRQSHQNLEVRRLKRLTESARREDGQLICFLHGPGGSGKTTVLDLVLSYAQEYCELLNYKFDKRTIVVTAISGVAATLLQGETTHSALAINYKIDNITEEFIEAWANTKLVIVDEISFASRDVIEEMDIKLRILTGRRYERFGGLDIVFSGDLRQIVPVKKLPLYTDQPEQFAKWINCYIALEGMHRFKNDPEWGRILMRFRDGTVTMEDIQIINDNCYTEKVEDLPDNARYACSRNRCRDAVNTGLFYKYCEKNINGSTGIVDDALVILSDSILIKNGKKQAVAFKDRKLFWEGCGEDDVDLARGRSDPVLKIYKNCPVMLTKNDDVEGGLANGTVATLEKVILKPGESTFVMELENGVKVNAVMATQVLRTVLRHTNDRVRPQVFNTTPAVVSGRVSLPMPRSISNSKKDREIVNMSFNQLPFIRTDATTGHKLQGQSMDFLYVSDWGVSFPNWIYVMLSRVRTMKGLRCRTKLDSNLSRYRVDPNLQKLLDDFEKLTPTFFDDFDYEEHVINGNPL